MSLPTSLLQQNKLQDSSHIASQNQATNHRQQKVASLTKGYSWQGQHNYLCVQTSLSKRSRRLMIRCGDHSLNISQCMPSIIYLNTAGPALSSVSVWIETKIQKNGILSAWEWSDVYIYTLNGKLVQEEGVLVYEKCLLVCLESPFKQG